MTLTLTKMLAAFSAVAMLAGLVIGGYALRRYRTESAPDGPTMRWRFWTPVWKTQGWFRERRGFLLYVLGTELTVLGALALLIATFLWSR